MLQVNRDDQEKLTNTVFGVFKRFWTETLGHPRETLNLDNEAFYETRYYRP